MKSKIANSAHCKVRNVGLKYTIKSCVTNQVANECLPKTRLAVKSQVNSPLLSSEDAFTFTVGET